MAYKLHNPRILGQHETRLSTLTCPLTYGGPTKYMDHNRGGGLPNTQGVALILC